MNRAFMEHYLNIAYDDLVGDSTKGSRNYRHIESKLSHKEDEFLKLVGGIDSDLGAKFNEVMETYRQVELTVARLTYLQGAEDRDRMMR